MRKLSLVGTYSSELHWINDDNFIVIKSRGKEDIVTDKTVDQVVREFEERIMPLEVLRVMIIRRVYNEFLDKSDWVIEREIITDRMRFKLEVERDRIVKELGSIGIMGESYVSRLSEIISKLG